MAQANGWRRSKSHDLGLHTPNSPCEAACIPHTSPTRSRVVPPPTKLLQHIPCGAGSPRLHPFLLLPERRFSALATDSSRNPGIRLVPVGSSDRVLILESFSFLL